MIPLSNGHVLDHVVASGALAFDGRGWPWERPLVAVGLIRPELFAVTLKTLTRQPRVGYLRWAHPWTCMRLLPDGGAVNKVGLTNPGIEAWLRDVAPTLRHPVIVSLWGEAAELAEMAAMVDPLDPIALELNASCPNTGHVQLATEATLRAVEATRAATRHPLIVKTSVAQDYRAIARGAAGMAEAVSLNSVPWEIACPGRRTPLHGLERRVGGGGGGVSGRPAQALNWRAVAEIADDGTLPVIAPGIMGDEDVARVRALGARAVSYGAIHFRTPWRPTAIARRDIALRGGVITFRTPDNFHAHFRDGALLDALVPVFLDAGWRGRIAAEPNTTPPLLTGAMAVTYRDRILARARAHDPKTTLDIVPIMQLTEATTAAAVRDAVGLGVRVGKVYPFMVTTHSANGVRDYDRLDPALDAAEDAGMVVQFHGEHPDDAVEGLDKEAAFLAVADGIRGRFPHLRLTLEHVTTRAAVDWVRRQPTGVGATITVHHLSTTLDDVLGYSRASGGLMRVHCGCKPQPKRRDDRDALIEAALGGDPRFFYGGDDAAHPRRSKEAAAAACGVWNTMAALPLLVALFERHGALDRLEPFVAAFGASFYGLPPGPGTVTLVREPWVVPAEVTVPAIGDSLVPMAAGQTLDWRVLP